MEDIHTGGIDPGLVDTGVVECWWDENDKIIAVATQVFNKDGATRSGTPTRPIAARAARWLQVSKGSDWQKYLWIEAYRPRSNFAEDPKMHELIADLRREMPGATVLNNTGVKKVVTKELMQLLGLWSFKKKSNHQDLRSAARIMLYGMLKDPDLNRLLSDVVRDHLNGDTWDVQTTA